MKLTLLLLLSLVPLRITPPRPERPVVDARMQHKSGGRWYMSQDAHAVFCYGPVMMLQTANGGIQSVATFCRGDRTIVPLHE